MPPSKVRTGALRHQLLDVAIELLAADGVAAVTTRRVATRAGTSPPAIYELFGDKAGLVRALFFEGFRRLLDELDDLPEPDGSLDDLRSTAAVFRRFTRDNPRLFEVMYSRPFESFAPGPEEREIGDRARAAVIERIRQAVAAGTLSGDPVDIAHALLALAIGLATQETAGWLGSTPEARQRRWEQAVSAILAGYAGPRR